MQSLKRMISFVRGDASSSTLDGALELPSSVIKAIVLAKDAGHRGPLIGGYLIESAEGEQVICSVTPSGVTAVSESSGEVLAVLKPSSGEDAFTVSSLLERTSGESVVVLGSQSGRVVVARIAKDEIKVEAECEVGSAVTAIAVTGETIIAGTVDGSLHTWVRDSTPERVSVGTTSISAILTVNDFDAVWVASDNGGISVFTRTDNTPALTAAGPPLQFEGMQAVTTMVHASHHGLVICLSSCSDVFLIHQETRELVHQYPASLMTCGAALTTFIGIELSSIPGSTFLILGGVDGSLCVRELSRREKDGKLQCILHRCHDRLAPRQKSLDDAPNDPSEGCPITTISRPRGASEGGASKDVCVAGDASCALYIVHLNLRSFSSLIAVPRMPSAASDELTTSRANSSQTSFTVDAADDIQ